MGTRKKGAANRRARALGFRNDYERRKAPPSEVRRRMLAAGDTAGVARHDAAVEKNAERKVARADAITPTRHGEQVSSGDGGVLRAAVLRAARDDRRLSAIVTVLVRPRGSDAVEPRKTFRLVDLALWRAAGFRLIDVELWAKGGYSAEAFADLVRAIGARAAFLKHARDVMARAKYPDTPVALVHVDLTAED